MKQKNEQLKTMHQLEITKLNALIEGEEKERNRIAQDLHDGINGDLSAIKFQLMAFKKKLANEVDKENLEKSIAMIDTTCEQVRTISHNLTPYTISQYGLSVALEQFCNKMNHSSLLIDYQWFGEELVLPKNRETSLYRIVQELVQNAIKHAKAKEILVYCNNLEDCLNITIEDDGVGFDENKQTKGIGLMNIEKRVNYLNAKMEIESSNQGTTILISIPLKNKQL
ncbi:sensor histidine kinase [Flavobacterium sp. 9AF]|uniref:sensor histidine kinase n=1 Tax=Flavobacterium sp. 9AF TaxID=2653142 RepID=UPI001F2E7209|nr:sensor histidine kinase [Flavobacterium sp. 9AF]